MTYRKSNKENTIQVLNEFIPHISSFWYTVESKVPGNSKASEAMPKNSSSTQIISKWNIQAILHEFFSGLYQQTQKLFHSAAVSNFSLLHILKEQSSLKTA
jgi:hypothetical protein